MLRSNFSSRHLLGTMAMALGLLASGVWACSSDDPTHPGDPADAAPDTFVGQDAGDSGQLPVDASDSGVTVSPQRVEEIRACMDARWGSAPTRAALDVADDFDECTEPDENSDATGNANFERVVNGWAEPDAADHSQMRKIVRDR